MRPRLACVSTHPIQYQVPLWRELAQRNEIELKVYYASRIGLEAYHDPGFGQQVSWDLPLLDGYTHCFSDSVSLPLVKQPVLKPFPYSLGRQFRDDQIDCVLVHGYAAPAAVAGLLAAWRRRLPIIMRGDTHEKHRSDSPRRRLKHATLPLLLRGVDRFIAIGSWNREYWLSLGVPDARLSTALHAVDNHFFASRSSGAPEEARAIRERLGLRREDVLFLYCAKVAQWKGPDTLLEAMASLPREGCHLLMVGAGPAEEELRERARAMGLSNVTWAGFVNQMELPHYYAAADVFVLPSRYEPWGLVVNEAIACGTPCIVSDRVGAGPDLIQSFNAGAIFPAGDAARLASQMNRSLSLHQRESWQAGCQKAAAAATLGSTADEIVAAVRALTRR